MHDNFYIKKIKQKTYTTKTRDKTRIWRRKKNKRENKNHARAAPAENLKVKCY